MGKNFTKIGFEVRMLTTVFESINQRLLGTLSDVFLSPSYEQWLNHTRHNWLPIIPEYDLPFPSQNSTNESMDDTISGSSRSASYASAFQQNTLVDASGDTLHLSQTTLSTPTCSSTFCCIINDGEGGYKRARATNQQPLEDFDSSPIHQRRRTTASPDSMSDAV